MHFKLTLVITALAGLLRGELVFDKDPIVVNPKPEDEQIEVTFTFKNGGNKPLAVTGLESSCSCLEASLDKAIYAEGEKGSGKATFKISSFVGRHEKTLHIFTNDPAHREQILNFILDVPAVVNIEPKLLQWITGQKAEPKEFIVTMVGKDPMKITNVTATRENVKFEWKEIKPGREYKIILSPTDTSGVTIGALKIETDSTITKYQRQMAFFSIVRPEQAEKQVK
jgi:hypothetical protein